MKRFLVTLVLLVLGLIQPALAAFPTVEARTNSSSAASTTPTITHPSDGTSGKLILLWVSCAGTGTIAWTSTGFTEFASSEGADAGISIGYRWTDGSEDGDIVLTLSLSAECAWSGLRISGAENPATQAPEASTVASGTSSTPDPGTVTPTGGAKDYLFVAGGNSDDGTRIYTAAPASYSNLNAADSAGGGSGTAIGTAERQLNAASENPGTFTTSAGSTWRSFTVAVHPAAAVTTFGRRIFVLE